MNQIFRGSLQRTRSSARRLALLASAAGLVVAAVAAGPSSFNGLGQVSLATPAHADSAQRSAGFADVVEKVKPAVISVRVKVDESETTGMGEGSDNNAMPQMPGGLDKFFEQFGRPGMRQGMPQGMPHNKRAVTGEGSGFFISADGYAVTNNHVVDHAKTVQVTTDDGAIYKAKVVGTDSKTDLALIKVESDKSFPFVKFADRDPRVGDWVVAVGNPFGLGGTVTAGIVSARGRDIGSGPYDDYIQIDAPINKGNSGGPAFNMDGNVIGVNTAIFSPSGGSVGIGFDIPADTARTVVAQLKEHGYVDRAWLGVQIQPVTAEIADSLGLKKAEGALVAEPQANSPAQKAGIEAGDVITSVDGKEVKDARDLAKKIGAMAPKSSVKLTVLHKGAEKTLTLTLGELPNAKEARASAGDSDGGADVGKLGLTLAPAARVAGAGAEGVVVTGVESGGVAADHGFSTGDVIVEIAGKSVSTPADVRDVVASARTDGKRSVLIRVKKGDNTRFVALPLGSG